MTPKPAVSCVASVTWLALMLAGCHPAAPKSPPPLPTPTGLTITSIGWNQVLVTWDQSSDARVTGYRVYAPYLLWTRDGSGTAGPIPASSTCRYLDVVPQHVCLSVSAVGADGSESDHSAMSCLDVQAVTVWMVRTNLLVPGSFGLAIDPAGGALVAGSSHIGDSTDLALLVESYDEGGALRWSSPIDAGPAGAMHVVSADGTGNVYALGVKGTSAVVAQIDSAGAIGWSKMLSSPVSTALPAGLSTVPGGPTFIAWSATGDVDGQPGVGGRDAIVTALDATGTVQWTRQVGTALDDEALDVAATSRGVYVLWMSSNPAASDPNQQVQVSLTRFELDGTPSWTQVLAAGVTCNAWALAVGPDGKVHALGSVDWVGGCSPAVGCGPESYTARYKVWGVFDDAGDRYFEAGLGQGIVEGGSNVDSAGGGVAIDAWGNLFTTSHGNPLMSPGSFQDVDACPALLGLYGPCISRIEGYSSGFVAADQVGDVYVLGEMPTEQAVYLVELAPQAPPAPHVCP